MEINEMFLNAAKKKYRFPMQGQITAEDLFDLSMSKLDTVYKALKKMEKTSNEESLMTTVSTEDRELAEKLAIVRFVFNEKAAEKERQQKAAETKQKNQRIREIIAAKEDEALVGLSVEELRAMIQD